MGKKEEKIKKEKIKKESRKKIRQYVRYSLSGILLMILSWWIVLGQYYTFFYGRNGVVTNIYVTEENLFLIDVKLRDGLEGGPILIGPELNIKVGDIYKKNTWELIGLYSNDKQFYIYIALMFNIMSVGIIIVFLILFLIGYFEEEDED